MVQGSSSSLLQFARALQRVHDYASLVEVALAEVRARTPYRSAWLYVFNLEDDTLELLSFAGAQGELVRERIPSLAHQGDAMLEEVLYALDPVVVADARTDPRTNKQIVEMLGNRTIINVPLLLDSERLGALGVGTFGDDEGVRVPSPEELDYLRALASHVASAASRLRAEARRRELEAQLQRSQRLEIVGRLAGVVAHDFNNILLVILGNVDLLEADLADDAASPCLEDVREATLRGARLTRQLLSFSGRQATDRHPLDLYAAVAELLSMLGRLLPSNLAIELQREGEVSSIDADIGQMEQLVVNLVVHARDAMPTGGTIRIGIGDVRVTHPSREASRGLKPGHYVRLRVEDARAGMSRELHGRVFEPFFSSREGAGTGLGLTVVKSIVDQYQGVVDVEREPETGSCFDVYLPVCGAAAEPLPVAVDAPAAGRTRTILVAEDDPRIRRLLLDVLQRAGYDVCAVSDGREALDLLSSGAVQVDLLISDVMMPGVDGFELRDAVRARGLSLPVLFMTGCAPRSTAPLGDSQGSHQIAKPFRPAQLLAKVHELLGSVAQAHAPRGGHAAPPASSRGGGFG